MRPASHCSRGNDPVVLHLVLLSLADTARFQRLVFENDQLLVPPLAMQADLLITKKPLPLQAF